MFILIHILTIASLIY